MPVGVRERAAIHGVLCGLLLAVITKSALSDDGRHYFNVDPKDSRKAVLQFGTQAGVTVVVPGDFLQGRHLNPVIGDLSVEEALNQLLAGTGLTHRYVSDHAVALVTTSDPRRRNAAQIAQPSRSPQAIPVADQKENRQLDEVVVTAQRRVQNLQDVPISAQVIEGKVLGEQNLNSLTDLSETTPTVHVGISGRSANMYIRGIGSGESQTFDQSVGLFVDDIYHGRGRISVADTFDVERIEILKGPQSTFFGNNAIAGAMNVVTTKPTEQLDASARALYGDYGQYVSEGAIGGPLTETLAVRVAAIADGMTGWLHNLVIGRDIPGESNKAGRLTLRFAPSASVDATLKVEGGSRRNTGGLFLQDGNCPPPAPFVPVGFCKTAIGLGVPMGLGNNNVALSSGQLISLDSGEYALTVNYKQWDQTFTSVSGFYNYRYNENLDGSGTPLNLLSLQEPEDYHQFSEELRVASPTDRRLEYLGGLYFHADRLSFQHNTTYYFLNTTLTSAPAFSSLIPYLPLGQDINYSQDGRTYSAFGSITWNAADNLKLGAGLRGTWVKKSYQSNLYYGTGEAPYGDIVPFPTAQAGLASTFANAAGLGVSSSLSGYRDDRGLMPSAQIQYSAAPDVMTYFSYAKGFKAGGFNGNDVSGIAANLPFATEHVNAYEVGLKSEWLDRRLLLNLDVFRSDYTNLQVTTNIASATGAIVSLVRNAGSARSQGVEFECQWAVARNFRLATNITYDSAHYVSYPNVSPTQLQQQLGQKVQDLSGRPTEYGPDWSGTVTAGYTANLPRNFRLMSSVSGILSSSYFLTGNDDETVQQGAYVRLDVRMSLETADGRWALDVIGKNLTSQDIRTFGIIWPTSLGSTWLQKEEPRNVAVQVRFHW